MPLIIGQLLNNRYRIDALLGQGGMGAVYRALDLNLNIAVAVKENQDASPEAQRQFAREASLLAGLAHPNLPRVTDHFFIVGQGQYLVMDFIDGEDLESMLTRYGVLPEPQVLSWIAQVCDALAYLHGQQPPIIHRDIKPANIRIRLDGRALLVDFGIAKVYDPNLATTIGAKAVAPGYSPPEQYGGMTDARSDIYALGATLYHLLTGQTPPESVQRAVGSAFTPLPHVLNQRISPVAEQAILKAIEVATDRRFGTVQELRAALTQPVNRASITMAVPPTSPAAPAIKRAPSWFWLAGLAGVVMCALGALSLSGVFTEARPTPVPPAQIAVTVDGLTSTATNVPTPTARPPDTLVPPSTATPLPTVQPATLAPATPTPVIRPSPVEAVADYYAAIEQRRYDITWATLSDRFKTKFNCSTPCVEYDLNGYLEWWNRVATVFISNVKVIAQNDTTATVYADLMYVLTDGSRVPDTRPYIQMVFDAATQRWLFDDKN